MPVRPSVRVVSMRENARSWSALQHKGSYELLLLDPYACPVSKREILPSSSTVKSQRVRISPQVSLL